MGGGTNLPLCGPNPACQMYQYQDCACVVWRCVVALLVVHGARGRVKEVGAVALLCRSGGPPLPSCPRSHVCMSLAGPCDPCRGVQECVLVYVHAGGFLQRAHGGRGVVYCCTHGCGQQQLRVNDCIPVCDACQPCGAITCVGVLAPVHRVSAVSAALCGWEGVVGLNATLCITSRPYTVHGMCDDSFRVSVISQWKCYFGFHYPLV